MTDVKPVPVSRVCTQESLHAASFQEWADRLGEKRGHLHRKIWEHCLIAETFDNYGVLKPGHRGLGFAVGSEPLPAFFASQGAHIVATDLDVDDAKTQGWVDSNQHAANLEVLNGRGLCSDDLFREKCSFRSVDMNQIPSDLENFDFIWSACAFEHLGSIDRGLDFVVNSMRCLRPGGIAVHTTEINCSSNAETVDRGNTVIFRRRDFERVAERLTSAGFEVDLDFSDGTQPADRIVDVPPYTFDVHLKLRLFEYVTTSYALVVRRPADGERPRRASPGNKKSGTVPELPNRDLWPPLPRKKKPVKRLIRRIRSRFQ